MQTQYGAICWRRIGARVEVLLITSRDTGRWVIPKGWPIEGLSPEATAAREAFEEAGVEGLVADHCIGVFSYGKGLGKPEGPRVTVPCLVTVFPLRVKELVDKFPEIRERRRKWFTPKKAARRVAEPELQAMLDDFEAHIPPPKAPASLKTSAPHKGRGPHKGSTA
ncbi:MAG: NUDIX hydrolase [Paracoccaceae bacterium]